MAGKVVSDKANPMPMPAKIVSSEETKSDVSFLEAVSICFRKYATFSGRASVKEYAFFRLFYAIILLFFGVIYLLIPSSVVLYALFLTVAVFFMPIYASTIRRLHDTGTSGFYIFMVFIPIIGAKLLLVKLCQKGDSGENQNHSVLLTVKFIGEYDLCLLGSKDTF